VIAAARRIDSSSPSSLTARSRSNSVAGNKLQSAGTKRLPIGIGHVIGLESDPAAEEARQGANERPRRLDEFRAFDVSSRFGIAEIREEPHAIGLDEERGVGAPKPREVNDVDRIRDEEWFLQHLTQPRDPLVHFPFTRNSSASR
jgi:hypothetical protein